MCPAIESVADRMHGVPVLKGTRMPTEDIVNNYNSGSPVQEIAENFGLNPQDVRTVLNYAASVKSSQSVR